MARRDSGVPDLDRTTSQPQQDCLLLLLPLLLRGFCEATTFTLALYYSTGFSELQHQHHTTAAKAVRRPQGETWPVSSPPLHMLPPFVRSRIFIVRLLNSHLGFDGFLQLSSCQPVDHDVSPICGFPSSLSKVKDSKAMLARTNVAMCELRACERIPHFEPA